MRMEAFYHDVQRENAALILAYDRRCVGYPRTFPQATENKIAVLIEERPERILVTQYTGIQFPFRDWDIHILLIVEEHPNPEYQQQAPQMAATPMG